MLTKLQRLTDDLTDSFYSWRLEHKLPWESQSSFMSNGSFICWLWCHDFRPGQPMETFTKFGRVTSKFYCHRCGMTYGEFKWSHLVDHGLFIKWRFIRNKAFFTW